MTKVIFTSVGFGSDKSHEVDLKDIKSEDDIRANIAKSLSKADTAADVLKAVDDISPAITDRINENVLKQLKKVPKEDVFTRLIGILKNNIKTDHANIDSFNWYLNQLTAPQYEQTCQKIRAAQDYFINSIDQSEKILGVLEDLQSFEG